MAEPRRAGDLLDADPITLTEASKVVYFLEAPGAFKIGFSTHLYKRLADLRTSSAVKITLYDYVLGDRRLEKELHRILASERMSGEWFADSDKTVDLISLISDYLETFDDDENDLDGRDVHVLTVEELHDIMARPYYWAADR